MDIFGQTLGHLVDIQIEVGGQQWGNACRPVEPRITLLAGTLEHHVLSNGQLD